MSTYPDFTGSWRADLTASKLHGAVPNAITASIVQNADALRVEMTIVSSDDTSARMLYEVRIDGPALSNNILGSEWVSRSRWVGSELLIDSEVTHAGRSMHFRDYWSMSDDGQRLTMEHRDDDLRGQITVLDRLIDGL
jgi:hypothetical protein